MTAHGCPRGLVEFIHGRWHRLQEFEEDACDLNKGMAGGRPHAVAGSAELRVCNIEDGLLMLLPLRLNETKRQMLTASRSGGVSVQLAASQLSSQEAATL